MGRRDELLLSLSELVQRIGDTGDAAMAWSPQAIAVAQDLTEELDEAEGWDIPVRQALGWLKWYQACASLGEERQRAVDEALQVFAPAAMVIGMVPFPEPLLPALADEAATRLPAMLEYALSSPDDDQFAALVDTSIHIANATPGGHPQRAHRLAVVCHALISRSARNGQFMQLDQALAAARQGVVHSRPDDPDRAAMMSVFAAVLFNGFNLNGAVADLDEAIEAAREAVSSGMGRPGERIRLVVLADMLWTRFQLTDSVADLDDMTEVRSSLAGASKVTDAGRSEQFTLLGQALLTRFDIRHDPADLDGTVKALRVALSAATTDEERLYCRSDLSCVLQRRFERCGARADLDEAADAAREAAAEAPAACSPGLLTSLAIVLDFCARTTGSLDDLDTAIGLVRRAAAATPAGYSRTKRPELGIIQARVPDVMEGAAAEYEPSRPELQRLLCAYLTRRFERTDVLADIDALVEARREALATVGVDGMDDGDRARNLALLSYALKLRFHRAGRSEDLEEAVTTVQQALAIQPGDGDFLSSLSDTFRVRFVEYRDKADLDQAVQLARRATQVCADDLLPAVAFANLSQVLQTRFGLFRDPPDVDEAVNAARAAVTAEDDGAQRPKWLLILGESLLARVGARRLSDDESGRETDRAEALRALSELVLRSDSAPPRLKVHGAKLGAWLAAVELPPGSEDFALAADLLEAAVLALPELAPRRMRREEQQETMETASGIAGDAAAMVLSDPLRPPAERARRALSLLEMGRSVLLSRRLHARRDLAGLHEAGPELAARFAALCDLLDGDVEQAPTGQDRIGAAAELAATLRRIRALDGFARFALPPTDEELLSAADRGPVVSLNVAYRGDALLLTAEGNTALGLPGVTAETVIDQINAFHVALREARDPHRDRVAAQHALTQVLKWLWDNITGPVLDALGHHGPPADGAPWPRVWWAPGGYLSLLPLHAAGHHDDPAEGRRTVMDRVVSSYTPTIGALRHARRCQSTSAPAASSALIVAMPETPGLAGLRNVAPEAELVRDLLPDSLLLTAPDRAQVLAQLPGRTIAHFACHGSFDPDDPSAGRLLLNDHGQHPLTVADLYSVDLDGAQLAYLSACHTAVNSAERLLDEGIHLVGALQTAGFPQVVGTMWELDDEIAEEITEDFYSLLREPHSGGLDLRTAGHALHHAVRKQRDRYPGTPSLWASHLHFGA
ncbi:CHAT domain-containing protein [Streptomyces sp. NPDC058686]|uniref:CHAT domain-containing protein n=1 Tax=Streptomyces sp. NPDC058686 TaxID=3346599 RepID=UPI003656FD54